MPKPSGVTLALLSLVALGPALAAPPEATLPPAAPGPWSPEALKQGGVLSEMEYGTARSDHGEVAQAVARCEKGYENPVAWTAATRAVLLYELDGTLGHGVRRPAADEGPGDPMPLTGFQKAALSFSDKLSRDRLSYRYDVERSRKWAYRFQVAAVLLGALATIFIGIRSILDRNSAAVTWFAALAIIASASSTAVTTLNTFANFQTEELRASKTLAQLQQLHWRVVADVVKNNLVCARDQDRETEKTKQVNAWRDRYEAISDAAVESLARPGDLSRQPSGPADASPDPGALQKPAPAGVSLYKAKTALRTTQK